MGAWHSGTLDELVAEDANEIAAKLAAISATKRLSPNPESVSSWIDSVRIMQATARSLLDLDSDTRDWHYFLEFEIPRRARRIDAVVLAKDLIFLIEFKTGESRIKRAALSQAEQYALDLRDFHAGSRDRTIVPIAVAGTTTDTSLSLPLNSESPVQPVFSSTPDTLSALIYSTWLDIGDPEQLAINPNKWATSAYRPTPNIIEAAQLIYEGHDVREIAQSDAGNLSATVESIIELIDTCRREHRKGIAFVTGSPGSGKTLAGLQLVHDAELIRDSGADGVFLSGNWPLVEVIAEALADSRVRNHGEPRTRALDKARTFIQHAYLFQDEHAQSPGRPPYEHVVIFDEAQRAWDAARVQRRTKDHTRGSEPQSLLEIMGRHDDWAVIIALVGSGQEINTGEVGLAEWGRALTDGRRDWIVRASPAVLPESKSPVGGGLFPDGLPTGLNVTADPTLHLQMNVRSPRAERLNHWVDSLLAADIEGARGALPAANEYPMVLTRNLDTAKAWLRERRDEGDYRVGLLASASARRLRAWGIQTKVPLSGRDCADWFLRGNGDIRSSNHLEVAATNFDCQGLELDWGGVCWGNDFVFEPSTATWRVSKLRGNDWVRVNDDRARFILNGYRVLLTRARRGQVIWVPQPDGSDPTLDPADFDQIAALLNSVGVPSID